MNVQSNGFCRRLLLIALCLCLTGAIASAQQMGPRPKKSIIQLGPDFLNNIEAKGKFLHGTKKTSDAIGSTGARVDAVTGPTISSVPIFSGSFDFQGTTFPYIMVGRKPSSGIVTHVKTALLPVVLVFPDFVDANGNPFVLDPTGIVKPFLNSPIFERANFTSGFTQYGDAIQRATFFANLDEGEWHVFVDNPEMLKPIVVEVPFFAANLFEVPGGTPFAVLDDEFWQFQLDTILQLADVETNEFAMILTQDMVIARNADPNNGFALGFHEAIPVSFKNNVLKVQTFTWGSWISATALGGFFSDILPLSHETVEFLNDPFLFNPVPLFQIPGAPPGTCQGNLEVGDPLAGVPFPVTTDGFTYNPQVVALLQWFERKVPSDAIGGAYSYPDTTVLTSPPPVCVPAKPPANSSK
jgi:hypothetical protein